MSVKHLAVIEPDREILETEPPQYLADSGEYLASTTIELEPMASTSH